MDIILFFIFLVYGGVISLILFLLLLPIFKKKGYNINDLLIITSIFWLIHIYVEFRYRDTSFLQAEISFDKFLILIYNGINFLIGSSHSVYPTISVSAGIITIIIWFAVIIFRKLFRK